MSAKYENLKIRDWAEEDRPREKLLSKGRSSLSLAELIAILIGSGTPTLSAVDVSKIILQSVNNDLNGLARLTVKDLQKFKGIGEAKAISIVAAMELGRRRVQQRVYEKPMIRSAQDAYELMKPVLMDLPHEEFWVLLLNNSNRVVRQHRISTGGVSATIVDPKIIFKYALEELATSLILIHNHPSGQLKPSSADIKLTNKLKAGAGFLEIALLDHVIFTSSSYYSFSEEGML